ncbi:hypothetical protein [Ponticoccus alexandrii]|uniref:Uncharacterized protein n=1 Tax=Ponticoccus alexandrii TaxID=1943633 RepID=A0ABX7FHY5_9RHOB|nr:hypothetical protein [Ponticoccus alexandrii]ETA52290.1 hypothetical protein P279_09470 [Rhodobacteraceae bacterium PD-2]QRF69278.1 hypothetical protein GQA70_23365 [Ponticoccus alexandrii]
MIIIGGARVLAMGAQHAGLAIDLPTPAHGAACDIAGPGLADRGATFNAAPLGRKLSGRAPGGAAIEVPTDLMALFCGPMREDATIS